MEYKNITFEVKNEVAYIGFGNFENKSMTTLGIDTLKELEDSINGIKEKANKEIKGLVFFSHKRGCFLAGVDVSIIQGLSSEAEALKGCERGQGINNEIEDLPIPTVALIDGICLGGGLELALSCKKIFISDSKKTMLGLPEVKLGVLPGFGGTYRLPRKIGLTKGMDLILTGKTVNARKATRLGLAQMKMPAERLMEKVEDYMAKAAKQKSKGIKDSIENLASDNFFTRKIIFQKAREAVLKQSKGFYPAPLKILEVLESGYSKNRQTFLSMEANAFAELSQTEQSKALQHIFFLTDNSKKFDKDQKYKKVKKGAVLGAGTMGGGIAWLFAQNNQAPIMKDINENSLILGLKQSSKNFMALVKRKKMTKDEFTRKQTSISPTLSYAGFQNVDLVIEAVIEDMNIKKKVFSELETKVKDDCILTSNTSSLSVNEMAKALEKPERFAGLHFFNPVNRMPLVEIIKHDNVSDDTIQSLYKWVLDSKKTPVVVGDGPGFLVNRILMPFINESAYLLEEGVTPEALDKAVLKFGMPMGPCRLMDEIGIDVLVKVGKIMEDGLGTRAKANQLSKLATEKNLLGRKTNQGFYLYDQKGKQGEVNPAMAEILPSNKVDMDETQIQLRVFLPMVNEAANILEDKIVDHPSMVDLGLIYGIGFPPFRGGLLRYADSQGLEKISNQIEKFADEVDKDRYNLSSFLREMVESKKNFYDL
ncbi:3-hydroxyacyl-CoA dehydrogenase NAD-binding domain-containing protein [Bacteriovoracaceae bacterium]|nr:3-hydroxyacyl-CoA dehydrogenase NAD-binding domain-containing protein [Bacteriovoracaceae bacterium]